MSVFSSSTSSFALNNDNNNSAPIRCQICANSTDPQIPPEAQLIPGAQLFNHVADHFNYRPHQCKLCGFETNNPGELVQHSQQTQHHQHVQLFSARNAFVEEFLNVLVEECKRRNTQNVADAIDATSSSSIKVEHLIRSGAPSPQSVSPIPSLTQLEEQHQQAQQQVDDIRQPQQQEQCQQCSTSTAPIKSVDENDGQQQPLAEEISSGTSAALLHLKSRLVTIASSAAEHLGHGDNCVENTNQIFASGASGALMNGDSSPNSAMAAEEMPALTPAITTVNEKAPVNVPLVSISISSTSPLKCLLCGRITTNYSSREYHCNTHLDLALYRCRICSKDFKHTGWRHHIMKQHRTAKPHVGMVHVYQQNMDRVRREAKRMYAHVGNAAAPPNAIPTQRSQQKIGAQQHTDTVGGNTEGERAPDTITNQPNTAEAVIGSNIAQQAATTSTPTTVTSTSALTTVSSTPVTVPLRPTASSSDVIIKTECGDSDQPQQTNNDANKKKPRMVSKVECAECGELVPDAQHQRLNHINAKHLKLWLYQCGVCHAEYTSTFNGNTYCSNHIKAKHRGHGVEAVLKAPDFEQKMREILTQYARFFGELSSD